MQPPRHARRRPAALLLALAPALGACSSYSRPALEVAGARLAEESADGLVIEFLVDARNDNDVALPLRSLEYTVDLDGRRVFRGVRSPEATLRRLGERRLTLPAAIPLGPSDPRPVGLRDFRVAGTLTYQTPGELAEVLFDTGVRRPEAGFASSGRIDLGAGPGSTIRLVNEPPPAGAPQNTPPAGPPPAPAPPAETPPRS